MAFTHPNPGEEIVADHVRQLTLSAAGSSGGGQIWKLIDLNDAANYALSVRNQHASGPALRVYRTTAGVDTNLLTVSNVGDLTTIKNLNVTGEYTESFNVANLTRAIMQRRVINVKDWGVLADGSDDTPRINAIFDAYRLLSNFGIDLYFPAGQYSVGKINATGIGVAQIRGVPGATVFYGDRQSTPGAVWDFTASNNLRVVGLSVAGHVYGSGAAPSVIPTCSFLVSETTTGGDSNANWFEHCAGSGYFSVSHFYLNCAVDSTYLWCHPALVSTGIPNFYLTDSNEGGIASAYKTVRSVANLMGNITFVNIGGQGVRLHNVRNINFFGGSIDGTTSGYCVKMTGSSNEKVGFYNTQFTSADAIDDGGVITVADGACKALTLSNPFLNNVLGASVALIKAEDGAIFTTPTITGLTTTDVGSFKVMEHADASPTTTVTIDGGHIDCGGGNLNPGGTIKGVTITKCGTYTRAAGGDEQRCLFIDPTTYPGAATSVAIQSQGILGNAIRVNDGAAASPSVTFTADPDNGLYRAGTDSIGVAAAGASVATISSTGLAMQNNQPIVPAAVSGTPAQHGLFRENLIKGWYTITVAAGTPSLADSFNVSGSVTDNGAGDFTVSWDRDFANADYAPAAMGVDGAFVGITSKAVGSLRTQTRDAANNPSDGSPVCIIACGDQ